MYSIDRFHDITELEFFLFGGTIGSPEPVFERDIPAFRSEEAEDNREVLELIEFSLEEDTVL